MTLRTVAHPAFAYCPINDDVEGAMSGHSRIAPQLRAVEQDIFRGECLVGRVAALAAISSARGRTHQASEARRVLSAVAVELLEPLYAVRSRLREGEPGLRRAT